MNDAILSRPSVEAWAYWLPKDPHDPDAWEDAVACSEKSARFALADGAASAYRAREWAMTLTDAYVADASLPCLATAADGLSMRRWFVEQAKRWNRDQIPPATWYEADAAQSGSAATFLGLRFMFSDGSIVWESVAVGDSCLFHIRTGRLQAAFPLTSPEEFTNRPDLLPSSPNYLDRALGSLRIMCGTATPGDSFMLASDATSEWLLAQAAEDPFTWERLNGLDDDKFTSLIRDLRQVGAIKADDVALIVIRVLDQ